MFTKVKRALEIIGMERFFYTDKNRHGLVGRIELQQMKRDFQIKFLKEVGLMPYHSLMDFGCGTLRGGIPIISYLDYSNYCGVEVRPLVLTEARKELIENDLLKKNPFLIEFDQVENNLSKLFDYIWSFSVVIHMSDDIFRKSLLILSKRLKPEGAFYFNVNIGMRKEPNKWQGFPVVFRPLTFYEEEAQKINLKLVVLGSLKSFGHYSGINVQDEQIMLKAYKEL